MDLFVAAVLFLIITYSIYFLIKPDKGLTATDLLIEGGDAKNTYSSKNKKLKMLSKSKEEELQKKIAIAGMNISVRKFYQTKILYGVLCTSASMVGLLFTGTLLFKLLVIISPFLYFYPNVLLKKRIKESLGHRKLELPKYQKVVATLLKNHSTTKAIMKSREYAGPYLKPFVDELAIELETRPGDDAAFRNFAKNVDLPEVHTFVVAIKQASEVEKSGAIAILDDQIKLMNDLQQENYQYLISSKPMEFSKWNFIVVMLMILYPMVIVYVTFTQTMQSI